MSDSPTRLKEAVVELVLQARLAKHELPSKVREAVEQYEAALDATQERTP